MERFFNTATMSSLSTLADIQKAIESIRAIYVAAENGGVIPEQSEEVCDKVIYMLQQPSLRPHLTTLLTHLQCEAAADEHKKVRN
jgi:hypothetical protein